MRRLDNPRKKVSVRIDTEIWRRLERLAENDYTTITDQIEIALSKYIATRRVRRKKEDAANADINNNQE